MLRTENYRKKQVRPTQIKFCFPTGISDWITKSQILHGNYTLKNDNNDEKNTFCHQEKPDKKDFASKIWQNLPPQTANVPLRRIAKKAAIFLHSLTTTFSAERLKFLKSVGPWSLDPPGDVHGSDVSNYLEPQSPPVNNGWTWRFPTISYVKIWFTSSSW